jgi:hypothetical protein
MDCDVGRLSKPVDRRNVLARHAHVLPAALREAAEVISFVLAIVVLALAQVAFAQNAVVSGVVTKYPGGEPAAGAVVKLVDEPPSTAPPGRQTQSATAAGDGSFRFDVPAGTYWIVANLQGYLPAEYGQRSPLGTGTSFDAAAGGRVNVRLVAWPTSGISGRVVDAEGDPVGRAQVLALRVVYKDGRPALTIAQTVMTNDRGEYRMFWLTPGSYRVAARAWDRTTSAPAVNIAPPRRFGTSEQGTSPVVTVRRLAGGAVVEEADVPIYAPSTPDVQLASVINLAPGDSAGAVDIQLANNRIAAHHVRGLVVRTVRDPLPNPLLIVPRTPSPFAAIASGVPRPDGSFDIGGIVPGSYVLYSQDAEIAQPLEMGDGDVEITITQPPPVSLKGHVTFERGVAPAGAAPKASDLMIQMTRDPDLIGAPGGGPRFNPPPSDDGTLALNTIRLGDYRMALWPFSSRRDGNNMGGRPVPDALKSAYVKSIRLGAADVLVEGLHLWAPTQAALEIVIALNGADVDGTAVETGRGAAANVTVVAVPDGSNRSRSDLSRMTTSDRQGHFSMQGLAPGDYTFYAWDDIERGAWESPEFVRAFEGRGRFVRLREGANDPIELNLVSGR